MPLPQDIRPVFQDIQDTLVRSDEPWIERSPADKLKVLWIGRETGSWEWMAVTFAYMLVLAYIAAFATYHVAVALGAG